MYLSKKKKKKKRVKWNSGQNGAAQPMKGKRVKSRRGPLVEMSRANDEKSVAMHISRSFRPP